MPTSQLRQQSNEIAGSQGVSWHVEEQFRLLVESVKDYAIFMVDTQGKILTWNQGAERIKGYKGEEIIGRHFSSFYLPEDVKKGLPKKALQTAAAEGRIESQGWRVRKDGSRFWADVVLTALHDPQGRLVAFSKITRDLTDRLQKEQDLRDSHESLRQLSSQLLRVQDEERQRLGNVLHDGAGQYLAMLKMHLDSLGARARLNKDTREKLAECVQLAEEAMKEVRTTSYELSPPMLKECGLASAIPWYLDGFMERSGIATTCEIADFNRPLRGVELAIFRILQESLTNTRRHSGSPAVHIRVQLEEDSIVLEVADQGKGIPPEILDAFNRELPGKLGVGLRSMRERIRNLDGNLEIVSSPQGTIIKARVPLGKLVQDAENPR